MWKSSYESKLVQEMQLPVRDINGVQVEYAQVEKRLIDLNEARTTVELPIKPRILLVIAGPPADAMKDEIANGIGPRVDNYAIQQALGADVLHLDAVETTRLGQLISRFFGPKIALAYTAYRLRHSYDIIYTTTEIVGLPLAMLLKLSRTCAGKPRHVTLSHYLAPFKKRIFFKFGAGSHIDALIVHCAAQRALVTNLLSMPSERVMKLPYFVDTKFWHPPTLSTITRKSGENGRKTSMICAVGLEFRDYATLVTAVSNLNVEVRIAAAGNHKASPGRTYGTARMPANIASLPSNVLIRRYNYVELRQLYTEAQFVVIPLCQRDAPAGATVILEAMAMGRAVIVSGTRGQTDIVRDPRNNGRGPVVREWWPGFLDAPDVAVALRSLPTGFYVTPGDADELRETINYLLTHPEIADELGHNGQRVAEACFSLGAFVKRFSAVIR
ncbi:MAG: glycosyltransferase family 4 protein, partial [Ktedonobacteraceae bacterium]